MSDHDEPYEMEYWFAFDELVRDQSRGAPTFAAFCEQFGITGKPKFREYEPTDEDKRILSELGIEA